MGVGRPGECAVWNSLNQDEMVNKNRKSVQYQVLKTAIIDEKAIYLIDMNAWYVVSVSSCQAFGGLVLRQKLYSL